MSHSRFTSYRDFMRGLAMPASNITSLLRLRRTRQIGTHDLEEMLRLNTPYRIVFGEVFNASANSV